MQSPPPSAASGGAGDPHVATLTSSLAAVPLAAVPAIIDCVLAASAIPAARLFHSLLDLASSAAACDSQPRRVVSLAGAVCHLIKHPDAPADAMRLFIGSALMPMLEAADLESLVQIEELLCDAVSNTESWDLVGEMLVPICLQSVGLCADIVRSEETDIYQWGTVDVTPRTVPLPTACHILTTLLDGAVTDCKESRVSKCFAANLAWDLSHLVLRLLSQSTSTENGSRVIRLLLPPVFSSLHVLGSVRVLVHGTESILSRVYIFKKIWNCCLFMFSAGQVERLDAYRVLSLYFSSYGTKGNEKGIVDDAVEIADLMVENEFWEEIRRGLVDEDASIRKQALYILRVSLNYSFFTPESRDAYVKSDNSESIIVSNSRQNGTYDGASLCPPKTKKGRWAEEEAKSLGVGKMRHLVDHNLTGPERWKSFLLLYEMLEEYGTHLVEAAWTHQVSLLFQSMPLDDYLNYSTSRVYQFQMETVEGIFSWLAVLWERGLFHGNPQVRCLIMESILGVDWDAYGHFAQKVPRSFVLGPFMLGLNDAVHHKDFGIKGVYTSKTIEGATKFFCQVSRQLSCSERVKFVWSLASVARQVAFGRAGLMTLAFSISSSACPYSPQNAGEVDVFSFNGEHIESAQSELSAHCTSDLLDGLGILVERSRHHFNRNYRFEVSAQVLKAVSSLINICDVPFDLLLHFLSTVPREFTDLPCPLRGSVQQWLTQINNKCCTFNTLSSETCVLKSLVNFPISFIKHEYSANAPVQFDDEDVDAWESGAKRWARILLLVVTEEKHLEPILTFLLNHSRSFSQGLSSKDWIPLKLFILILSLIEELRVGWTKLTCPTKAKVCVDYDVAKKLHHSSPLATTIVWEKLVKSFLYVLEDLVSFAKLVSPCFWLTTLVKDSDIPCFVSGKLGGPSQRRLSSDTTSAVLQAIFSLKAVASVSSWCAQLKKVDCLDPCFIFLWEFSWKIIQYRPDNSETGAEIHLAAFEALASVMKELSSTLSPVAFDYIMAYNKSVSLSGEDRPLLDLLILNFLKNINDLLATGLLTRSRRAVLMNWKWQCIDSILSIPYNITENGVKYQSPFQFFSNSTLRSTLLDIIESLENAGEISVLPILRSVRSVLGLLHNCTSNQLTSSGAGSTGQLMMQLVHSSWILHLSCNKRRVAPIAALLSAVLHRSLFSNLDMHETIGGTQGPLKWFIEKLLDEGIKSPRTIRLAALHLTGLWLLFPETIKYYLKELKLLSLYGSVAFDEDFEGEVSENCEATVEVSLLAQSPDTELTEVFINTEMYARVSIAVLFYKLATLAKMRNGQECEDSVAALHCGKLFLLELLDSAVNDKDLSKELYKKYSAIHRRKVRAWQMLCILSHFVEKDIVEEVTTKLHICLYRNNLPAVRQYLETFATNIYLKFPSLADLQLVNIFYDYNIRPQALSSYVYIATNLILHSRELPVQAKHLHELLPPIIPFLTSHHHSLRGFTQLLVHYVLWKLWPALRPPSSEVAPLEKRCFDDLKSYLEENIDCIRLRSSMESFLGAFDPNTSATPAGIFNAQNEGSEFECAPISLMEQVVTFLNDRREDLRYSMAKDNNALKNESLTIAEKISPAACNDISMDFQKKITLHKHVMQPTQDNDCSLGSIELSRLLLDIEAEDQLLVPLLQSRVQMESIKGTQQEIIIVASLLDRIPNLAGLVRTCEIFKAAGLAIADASIVQDKQFQLISVTADKWVPIIEVPVSSMKAFLEGKRRAGFSILGLEQTANSTPLDQYSFPSKTVLVLGRENDGIPVDIIHVLDACVEIPQLGIIRSLNVHVSGAIALWEYTRQQRSKRT